MVAVGKCSSPVVREKCLSHKILAAHACSATNPGTAATSGTRPETAQLSCHCSFEACGNYSVRNILAKCRSGFVHANKCGACIRCAKDLDEACGGYADHVGNCRAGLLCQIAEADGNEGVGKCLVDKPGQRIPGFIYRNPKATFSILDLSQACQASENKTNVVTEKEGEVKVEVKVVAKGLRSLAAGTGTAAGTATGSKNKDKLSSVEKGWKEIFEDEENQHPVQTVNVHQHVTSGLAKQEVPVQNIYLAPTIGRVERTYQMPMLPSQPPSWGW